MFCVTLMSLVVVKFNPFVEVHNFPLSFISEPCIVLTTNESGKCIALGDCHGLADDYKKDRTHVPTICNIVSRKVCCPLRLMQSDNAISVEQNVTTTTSESSAENYFDESEPFIASQIIKSKFQVPTENLIEIVFFLECVEYKKLLVKNETINSFILGEPSTISRVEICHQNKENIGIASEMEFPHIGLIKLQEVNDIRRHHNIEAKCVGSLISERHVITSFYCVNSLIKYQVTVQLGVFNYDSSDSNLKTHKVESLETKYGVTILKLQNNVVFAENIMPACLYPDKVSTSEVLLAAWNGDWRECESKLKKWHINNNEVIHSNRWQISIDQSAIINYRQVQVLSFKS